MFATRILPSPSCRNASFGETFGVPSSETVASQQSTQFSIDSATSYGIILSCPLIQVAGSKSQIVGYSGFEGETISYSSTH